MKKSIIKVFKSIDHLATKWPGGSSVELFIFPEGSEYRLRNFGFRISTATIELGNTEFTILKGFTRHIIALKGDITLSHENGEFKTLTKGEPYTFSGKQKTMSKGTGVDFNLMTREKIDGELKQIELKKGKIISKRINSKINYLGLYAIDAKFTLNIEEKIMVLNRGDFVVVIDNSAINMNIAAEETGSLVLVQIKKGE